MLLSVKALMAGYGKKRVLKGVTLETGEKEIISLIGHNGAGKTTCLKAIFGLIPVENGAVIFDDVDFTHRGPGARVKGGMALVPQERGIFQHLSVLENLQLAAYSITDSSLFEKRIGEIYKLFPVLKERTWQGAGSLSGGEQKMLSIGIALMRRPKLMILDEPSGGLAPFLVDKAIESIKEINEQFGMAILLVEQNVRKALSIANRVYVMKTGQIILEEHASNLLKRDEFWDIF
jgi:branched-chain amino acid transport system ATP-binding protein